MFQGYRIIGVTPYGRRRYVELLAHYLRGGCCPIDEHHFWVNTQEVGDLAWLQSCVGNAPSFFKSVKIDQSFDGRMARRIGAFFGKYPADRATIFIRFDDDIVWIEPQAIERLLAFRIAHPDYLLVYANTVNNSLCSNLHQQQGILADCSTLEYECMGKQSWRNWVTAACAHRELLRAIEQNDTKRFHFPDWKLTNYERCSINCICWWGSDATTIANAVGQKEEHVLASRLPRRLARPNCIAGQALVAHFAYRPQRRELESNTNLLAEYRRLAGLENTLGMVG
jgi:hypothetical protein